MTERKTTAMPAGIGNAFVFQALNTISFSIVVGTPMTLWFKQLGASATVLGIVAALPALLNIFQIPAARFVEEVGYRLFVLRGWTVRCFFILGMALTAFLPARLDSATRMALMLFLLFAYNTSRGFSAAGFLPWITNLVPEAVRGRYLSIDQMCTALAVLGTMIATALLLGPFGHGNGFGWIFVMSFVAGFVSLIYLRRIPDVPVPEERRRARVSVDWREVAGHSAFRRLMIFNIIYFVSMAGGVVLWVPFLRDVHHFKDWQLLAMSATWSSVAAVALWLTGRSIDRIGSRPLLGVSCGLFVLHFALWMGLAARMVPMNLAALSVIQLTSGFGGAMFNLANTRLAMGTVPAEGRSRFFAVFSVVNSMVMGLMPIVWGITVDALAGWHLQWGRWDWNQYTLPYAAIMLVMAGAVVMQMRLAEPRAMSTEDFLHELLVGAPTRMLARLPWRRPWG
jgi:MFS family permease